MSTLIQTTNLTWKRVSHLANFDRHTPLAERTKRQDVGISIREAREESEASEYCLNTYRLLPTGSSEFVGERFSLSTVITERLIANWFLISRMLKD